MNDLWGLLLGAGAVVLSLFGYTQYRSGKKSAENEELKRQVQRDKRQADAINEAVRERVQNEDKARTTALPDIDAAPSMRERRRD